MGENLQIVEGAHKARTRELIVLYKTKLFARHGLFDVSSEWCKRWYEPQKIDRFYFTTCKGFW